MKVSDHGILFNSPSDITRAHSHPELDAVAHVFDAYWHGIRSATACLPGHKIAISHKNMVSGDGLHRLMGYVAENNIRHVCYQGFSENALRVAEMLQREFGTGLSQYVITHVSPAQFENHFEMRMIRKMINGLKSGLFRRIGSVKPRFSGVVPEFWNKTLINLAPNIGHLPTLRDIGAVFIPVENNWRKNLYSNVLAAVHCKSAQRVYVVNWPSELEHIAILKGKVDALPFMRPAQLLARAAASAAIMHSSLIECQPMTQLEALAVGTPCITASLGVHPEIDKHPLTQLCEVDFPDDVGALSRALEKICQLWASDPQSMGDMVKDQLAMRKRLSMQSYLEFIG